MALPRRALFAALFWTTVLATVAQSPGACGQELTPPVLVETWGQLYTALTEQRADIAVRWSLGEYGEDGLEPTQQPAFLADGRPREELSRSVPEANATFFPPVAGHSSRLVCAAGEPGTMCELAAPRSGGARRAFAVVAGGSLHLEGFRLSGWSAPGGGAISVTAGGSLTLRHCVFEDNEASAGIGTGAPSSPGAGVDAPITAWGSVVSHRAAGGALFVGPSATVLAENVTFARNTASPSTRTLPDRYEGAGGAVVLAGIGASMRCTSCAFLDNYAGGAGGAVASLAGARFGMTGGQLARNAAGLAGGAVAVATGGHAELVGVQADSNTADSGTGGTAAGSATGSALLLKRCALRGSSASTGGVLMVEAGALAYMESCHLERGAADGGGGCLSVLSAATAALVNSTVAHCRGASGGAAEVRGRGSLLELNAGVMFVSNRASGSGGHLAVADGGEVLALGTRFEAGEAAGSGGALWLSNGTLLASGATLAGNRAPGGLGGAVALAGSSARLVLEGGALQGNFAGKLGGGVAASGGAQVLLLGGGNGGYLLLKGNEAGAGGRALAAAEGASLLMSGALVEEAAGGAPPGSADSAEGHSQVHLALGSVAYLADVSFWTLPAASGSLSAESLPSATGSWTPPQGVDAPDVFVLDLPVGSAPAVRLYVDDAASGPPTTVVLASGEAAANPPCAPLTCSVAKGLLSTGCSPVLPRAGDASLGLLLPGDFGCAAAEQRSLQAMLPSLAALPAGRCGALSAAALPCGVRRLLWATPCDAGGCKSAPPGSGAPEMPPPFVAERLPPVTAPWEPPAGPAQPPPASVPVVPSTSAAPTPEAPQEDGELFPESTAGSPGDAEQPPWERPPAGTTMPVNGTSQPGRPQSPPRTDRPPATPPAAATAALPSWVIGLVVAAVASLVLVMAVLATLLVRGGLHRGAAAPPSLGTALAADSMLSGLSSQTLLPGALAAPRRPDVDSAYGAAGGGAGCGVLRRFACMRPSTAADAPNPLASCRAATAAAPLPLPSPSRLPVLPNLAPSDWQAPSCHQTLPLRLSALAAGRAAPARRPSCPELLNIQCQPRAAPAAHRTLSPHRGTATPSDGTRGAPVSALSAPPSTGLSRLEWERAGLVEVDFATEIQPGLKAVLGSGAFGDVYLATWRGLEVAVKVFNRGYAGATADQVESFKQEVLMMTRLGRGCRQVIRIHGACFQQPCMALIYQYVPGGSLHDRIYSATAPPLTLLEVLKIGRDLASGLAYLHPYVVHRDLKPMNILLDSDGTAMLIDFGVSRERDPQASYFSTKAGGTAAYMAPEMFTGSKFTEKVDVYALGCVLCEALARQAPWAGQTNFGVIVYHVSVVGERPPLPPGCPRRLGRLISRCWAADPHARPSCYEVMHKLGAMIAAEEAALTDGGRTAPPQLET